MSNEKQHIPRTVSLPLSLINELEDIAEMHDVSVSQIVRIALYYYLNTPNPNFYVDPYNQPGNASDEKNS